MLYIGETESLFGRLKKHLKHSDNRGLAHWIWEHGKGDLHVECFVLPDGTTALQRRAVEANLIAANSPVFNTPRSR